jgi:hypothetical protein
VVAKELALETPRQLRAAEIARNLDRITDQLAEPDRDPTRLHHQLLDAQSQLIASLVDLNAMIGSPAPLPSPTRSPDTTG